MSDQIKEFADVPKDFIKDGTQFINSRQARVHQDFPSRGRWFRRHGRHWLHRQAR
ncbi:hypothetical protein MPH_11188 [Macrophomina phaseolina MS6]|uniref:Uncharacterized protein n=1 Tax=Macrophomina phaseolina (strain MS6) TaxID=1126212 RepID=K2S4P4_MACPH|nr:hypothetical protein MPH_11188 [Macrophomina phaseolina MS6]